MELLISTVGAFGIAIITLALLSLIVMGLLMPRCVRHKAAVACGYRRAAQDKSTAR